MPARDAAADPEPRNRAFWDADADAYQAAHGDALAVCGSATASPFAAASFDLVFCDHGAMSFCDPARTVPECARLLRDGGRLVFSVGTQLLALTWEDDRFRQTRRLQHRWRPRWTVGTDEGTVDVVWSHGEWIRAFRDHSFVVDDLVELVAPTGATTTYDFVPYDWARRWPAEEIWCLTRAARAGR